MALHITLVKTPTKVSVTKTAHVFDGRGGTIGRSDANAWVLPDPDKFLSSCHCEVLFENNSYLILDLSTNGTFVNSAHEPLGKGSKKQLHDGDAFDIGDYKFSVKISSAQPFIADSPFARPTGLDTPFNNPTANLNPGDGAFSALGMGYLQDDFALTSDFQNEDPLALLDKARPQTGDPFRSPPTLGHAAYAPASNPIFSSQGLSDHTPSLDQAIAWPSAAQENLIPENWEDDLLAPSPKPAPVQPRPSAQPVPNVFTAEPPTHAPSQTPHATFQAPPALTPITAPTPTRSPATTAMAAQPTHENNLGKNTAGDATANHRLIAAMGLNANNLSAAQINAINDSVGELMRDIVGGMMQVLRSRTSIKNEFRMNVTTIQPVENNPLKFSVGVDEALENMFIKQTNAYKKPADAFREGFQEIGEHQLAMISGIRHGFERMMERFNPENLEKNFNKQGKTGVIPGMQKAKYWSNYNDYYASLGDNMESSFQHLFGSDFVNAYEDQLRKLAATRKKTK